MQHFYEYQGMWVPAGSKKIDAEVWISNGEIIILGEPEDISQDFYDAHNCDVPGCGAFGPHVLFRFSVGVMHRDHSRS